MTTIYVSTTGSDSSSGASGSPVKSISKAAQLAKAGDTVLVAGGVYNGNVSINNSGTASAPITIKAAEGAHVIIDGSQSAGGSDLVTITGDYVTFQGFEVRNAKKGGISLWETHDTKILDNNVHDSVRVGIWAGGNVGNSYNNLIDGNEVWHNVLENSSRSMTGGGWAQGISLDKSDGSVISNNYVHGNYGEGVGAMFTKDAKITGNKVYDSFSVGIYLDNAQGAVVQSNTVAHTYDTDFYRSGKPATGIEIANESGGRQLPSSGLVITNNMLGGVGDVHYSTYGANTGLVNSTIGSNTVYSSPDSITAPAKATTSSAPAPAQPLPTPADDSASADASDLLTSNAQGAFVFDTDLGKGTKVISDFNTAKNTIQLDHSIFTELTKTGALSPRFFELNDTAKEKNDHIVYDKTTGDLSYDADGSGSGAAVKIAVIENKAALTAADFFVI